LVAAAFVSAGVSLSQFSDGARALRTAANLVTVAIIVVLVVRYLGAGRKGDT
jgi:hypothetical protein